MIYLSTAWMPALSLLSVVSALAEVVVARALSKLLGNILGTIFVVFWEETEVNMYLYSGQSIDTSEQSVTPTMANLTDIKTLISFGISDLEKQFWLSWFQLKSLHLLFARHLSLHSNAELVLNSSRIFELKFNPVPYRKHPEKLKKIQIWKNIEDTTEYVELKRPQTVQNFWCGSACAVCTAHACSYW